MTARFSQGKYALSISDRSGQAFPYLEMVREWTGARTEFATTTLLQFNPFFTTTAGTSVIRVYQPGHARTLGNTYRFYGPPTVSPGTGTTSNPVAAYADVPNFDGIDGAEISRAAGHIISQWGTLYAQTYNNYQFTVTGYTATNGNVQGGGSVSIGPVTIQA